MQSHLAISQKFSQSASNLSALGNGLINDTFLVQTSDKPFVLQRINHSVFPKPAQIMANLSQLNRHVAQKPKDTVKLIIPAILKTKNNDELYQDEQGSYWRALEYIANTESLETITHITQVQQTGFALGHFHRLVSDLDPSHLYDTLPGFHIAPDYLSHYQQVLPIANNVSSPESQYCAAFIASHQHIINDLEAAKQQGLLPLRVIHGDPKLNNFLFAKDTQQIISLIDLDTVKPGLVHYDIGDCLRSCCHNLATNEFDLEIATSLLTSYLSEAGLFFSEADYDYLYASIRLIPFELGLRFYTDYLEGNRYFKVTEPDENLHRAVNQFQLCESIMQQELAINAVITRLKLL
jgi:Ser/Thr protein kinase RdoA (MazF antagonist)